MTQHYKITKQCPKKWEELVLQEKGHYCDSCKKLVMDLDLPNVPKPGDMDYTGCGKFITKQNKFTIQQKRFSFPFVLRWVSLTALLIVPFKKSKAQQNPILTSPEIDTVNKRLYNVKRVVGQLRKMDRHFSKEQVQLRDDSGIISEAQVMANGRFILNLDSSKIQGDSIEICAENDSIQLRLKLDSIILWQYPKETLFINVYPIIIQTISFGSLSPIGVYEQEDEELFLKNIPFEYKPKDQTILEEEKIKKENTESIAVTTNNAPNNKPKIPNYPFPEIVAVLNMQENKNHKNRKGQMQK